MFMQIAEVLTGPIVKMTGHDIKKINSEAHIAEDLCRCFGRLERNGIQAELVAAVAYLGPGFLVAALRMWKYKVIST